uniref:spindle pole body component 110-like n=1 Tax=Erigeron canadensis TaxID=72917 RepID=UPI001CB99B43|nr:spindle pole body component 110-like [Erigeron canadensis]
MKRVSTSNSSISASLEKLKDEFLKSNLATEVPGLVSSLHQLSQSNILFTAHLNQQNHTVSTFSKHQDDFLTTLTQEISSLKSQSSSAATSDDRTSKLETEVGELKGMMHEMLGLLKTKMEAADASAASKGEKTAGEVPTDKIQAENAPLGSQSIETEANVEGKQTKERKNDEAEKVDVEGEKINEEVAKKTAEEVPAGLTEVVPKPAEVVPARPINVSSFKPTPEFHAALDKRFAEKGKAVMVSQSKPPKPRQQEKLMFGAFPKSTTASNDLSTEEIVAQHEILSKKKEEELSAKFISGQIVNEELKGADEETRKLGLAALKRNKEQFFAKKAKTLEESQAAYLKTREIRQREEEILKVTPTLTQQGMNLCIQRRGMPKSKTLEAILSKKKEEELSAKFISGQIVNEELKGADEETRKLGLAALKRNKEQFFAKKAKTLEESQASYLKTREIRQREEEILKVTPTLTQQGMNLCIQRRGMPKSKTLEAILSKKKEEELSAKFISGQILNEELKGADEETRKLGLASLKRNKEQFFAKKAKTLEESQAAYLKTREIRQREEEILKIKDIRSKERKYKVKDSLLSSARHPYPPLPPQQPRSGTKRTAAGQAVSQLPSILRAVPKANIE